MKAFIKRATGFTLIELMVVVVILGILATVMAPRIPQLVNKAKEGATKGSLGSFRSAIDIYYSDNEGIYPLGPINQALVPRYLKKLPVHNLPGTGHEPSSVVGQSSVSDPPYVLDYGLNGIFGDVGTWCYCNLELGLTSAGGETKEWGDLWIGCTHLDTGGTSWYSY